jgi:RNA polymerase sigma factor (sigma-70 family)
MSATAVMSSDSVRDDLVSLSPQVMTDERLVKATKTGHRAAFDELYKRHRDRMFRVTHRITRNREDAEDAVQDCFLNAFLHLRSFGHKARFSTWLTRIAINAALMKLRKNHASREVPIDEQLEIRELSLEHEVADSSLNPERLCAKSEQQAIVRDAVGKLRPEMRMVVEIRLQDCSLGETAERLGISVVTAKARLFRARSVLRQGLRSQDSLRIYY